MARKADKLAEYRSKRDLDATPEPGGVDAEQGQGDRFVVQEHDATNLHWDLRLEREGVLVCWALPRGIPWEPTQNRLAVHVEDHPLSYIDFQGEIPAGQYGAGQMAIWDTGVYETHKFRRDEVIVTFRGDRLTGKYVLFQTDGKNWMIHRMDAPLAGRQPLPVERLTPMRAKRGPLPRDDEPYVYEIRWDGIRSLFYSDAGHTKIVDAAGDEIGDRFPEVKRLGRALGMPAAVFDGVIVALDEQGKVRPDLLGARQSLASKSAIARAAKSQPATYMIFDLLFFEGYPTGELPYERRRSMLGEIVPEGSAWRLPPNYPVAGAEMLTAARDQGIEAVIAKRLGSRYAPGGSGDDWIEVRVERGAGR